MATFYDTHAHLDYPEFAEELPQVISRAQSAGIAKIITIGTDLESSKRAIELAEQFPNVFAVVGWHPSHASEAPDDLRKGHEDLSPPFTTYREQVDGKYWFPVYTKADDELHFKMEDVHIKEIVKYEDYKRFGANSKILYEGKVIPKSDKAPDQKPDEKKPQ